MEAFASSSAGKTSRKTRAAGAFRALIGFLQKPARRSQEYTLPVETPGVHSKNHIAHDSECEMANIDSVYSWNSPSNNGFGKVTIDEISFPVRPADNTVGSIVRKVRDRFLDTKTKFSKVDCGGDDGTDEDDDVFLEDSYFEDDYLEDFSSNSTGSNEPPTQVDYTDSNPYLNNLDSADFRIEKSYDKIFPEFYNLESCPSSSGSAETRRQRRHSMPCNLMRGSTGISSDTCAVDNSRDVSSSNMEDNCRTYVERSHSFDQFGQKSLCQEQSQETQSIFVLENATTMNVQSTQDPTEVLMPQLAINQQDNVLSVDDEVTYSSLKPNLKITPNFLTSPPIPPPNDSSSHSGLSISSITKIQQSSVLDRPEKFEESIPDSLTSMQIRERSKRRCHSRIASTAESGYGSVDRLSPLTPFLESPDLRDVTPMNKLHAGTVLSPHSLDKLDGVSRPRYTPKRSLPPKFVFPSPISSHLRAVPELCEVVDMKDPRMDLGITEETMERKSNRKEAYESIQPRYPQGNTGSRIPIETPVNGVDFRFDVSLHFVDLNNNRIDYNNNHIGYNPEYSVHGQNLTPFETRHCEPPLLTPLRRPLIDANHFQSPISKVLRPPICTSSPLHSKLPDTQEKTPLRKQILEPIGTPALSASPGKVMKSVSPIFKHRTPSKISCRNRDIAKSTTERRKKLKRRSVRARLLFDEKDSNTHTHEGVPRMNHPCSRDYLLLKNIAESIINQCSNHELIDNWVDMPYLMENLNTEYANIGKYLNLHPDLKLSNLKNHVVGSKLLETEVTTENCTRTYLLACLIQDTERIRMCSDFIFENLPAVVQHHDCLSALAPEVVAALLSNPRRAVHNGHGFPLPYASSEMEVFKAVVKYVERVDRQNRTSDRRIKNILSTVADAGVLSDMSGQKLPRNLHHSSRTENAVIRKPPRQVHTTRFHRSSPFAQRCKDNLLQPFISKSVQSLEDLTANNVNDCASPVKISSVCKQHYVLRKLYFSYRRYNGMPHITKIGMQYSYKGRKKTFFIAQSEVGDNSTNSTLKSIFSNDGDRGGKKGELHEVSKITCSETGVTSNDAATGPNKDLSPELTMAKKTAIVLKAGEHVQALSVLTTTAVHNVEIVTNTGRRIRAHGLGHTGDARWVSIATPQREEACCLHAICGDVRRSAGRSYITDLGAIWMTSSYEEETTLS